jgi:fucose permease
MTHSARKSPNLPLWFTSTFLMFMGRAFLYSTWVSRGPEIKQLLDINDFQYGALSMLYPVGGLIAVQYASSAVHKYGSKKVTAAIYTVGSFALVAASIAISNGSYFLSASALSIAGAGMAIADFTGNYEGNKADKASSKSIFSAIHSAFGLGMMAAAAFGGYSSDNGISIEKNFIIAAAIVFISGLFSFLFLPHQEVELVDEAQNRELRRQIKETWKDRRNLTITLVGASFILAEMSAGTWVPIALTQSGWSTGDAAFALSFFWVVVTIVRAIGGFIVNAIGRYRTVKFSAFLTVLGLVIFMATNVISLPYLGLLIWAVGMAIGFPMTVSAMGDDPKTSAARINMIMSSVYITSITVGPLLGSIAQLTGIYLAFLIPVALSLTAFKLSPITAEEKG